MKRNFVTLALVALLVFVIGFAFAVGAEAQEATPEPTPVDVVETPAPEATIPAWLMSNIVVVLGALAALIMILQTRQATKANKDAVEAAYEAMPPGVQEMVVSVLGIAKTIIDGARDVYEFVEDVTDGEPNDDKAVG